MHMAFEYKRGMFEKPRTYAVKHKDFSTRMTSRSGGIFTALSDKVLSDGGVVYGCVLDENFTAIHVRAESVDVRNRMRGSKYVQSEMRDVYRAVKVDLEVGKWVLFSGTSCQVAGLKGYLGVEYKKLICVDIVCHGVPSPLIWKHYLNWQEKKRKSKVVEVDFRNKKDFGWREHIETILFADGKRVDSKIFTTLFYGHSIIRPCCYYCPYKDIIHPGDITIADYWGIEKAAPEFFDNKGVSLVLNNNQKGESFFSEIKQDIEYKETRIEDSMQAPFSAPFPCPTNRNDFWNDVFYKDFSVIAREYGGDGIKAKLRLIKRKLGYYFR